MSCYKTNSASKLLIYNDFLACTFFVHRSQAIDFPKDVGRRGQPINKVIHKLVESGTKGFQIKDLSATLKFDLNSRL